MGRPPRAAPPAREILQVTHFEGFLESVPIIGEFHAARGRDGEGEDRIARRPLVEHSEVVDVAGERTVVDVERFLVGVRIVEEGELDIAVLGVIPMISPWPW